MQYVILKHAFTNCVKLHDREVKINQLCYINQKKEGCLEIQVRPSTRQEQIKVALKKSQVSCLNELIVLSTDIKVIVKLVISSASVQKGCSLFFFFSLLNVQVMPYSTKCNTPLSNFEANQNYKDTVDPAGTFMFSDIFKKQGL